MFNYCETDIMQLSIWHSQLPKLCFVLFIYVIFLFAKKIKNNNFEWSAF